jgi:hypothetical protein
MKSYSAWQRDELFQALGPLLVQFRDDLYNAAIAAATRELQDQLLLKQEAIEVALLEQRALAARDAMRAAEKKLGRQWVKFDEYIEEKKL